MITRFIPQDAIKRCFNEIPAVVYLYTGNDGKPAAVAYGGKRSKPDWHFRFQNDMRREKKIEEWLAGLKAHADRVKEYRAKQKENPSEHAKGAKNLKADLEANFPGVKFSVRSKTFSMGDDIRVSWTDGPTCEEVDLIAKAYQHGHFNSMEDIYEHDSSGKYDRGSAKYVNCSRRESPSLIIKAAQAIGYDIPTGESDRSGHLPGMDFEQSKEIYRKARTMAVIKEKNHTRPVLKVNARQTLTLSNTEGVTVTENIEKKGIEIRFQSKPAQEVIEILKAHGWRWSRFNVCWYNKNTQDNMDFAQSFTVDTLNQGTSTVNTPRCTAKRNTQDIVTKLRTLADGMEKTIDGKINSGIRQQNPTRRRSMIAEGMRKDGEQLQKVQFLLRALADMHEAGNIPTELARITTKTAAHTALFGYQDKIQAAVDIANKKLPEDPKEKSLRDLDRELIGCKIPGFFVTPKEKAKMMVELADIQEGMDVCEPEAGRGDIAEHINHGARLTCIEYNYRLAEILKLRGFNTICGDFLEHTGTYDRIVMNPPFEHSQDIKHTRHAFQCLKPKGRLVSIVSEGAFFRNDKIATAFREWIDEMGAEVIGLPSGAFSGTITSTGVKARIVVVDKIDS